MATTLWNGELVEAANYTITANDPVDLLTSSTIPNPNGHSALKVTTKFVNLVPANVLMSGELGYEIDFKNEAGQWEILPAYMAQWIRKSDQAPNRVIISQPNINQLEPGIVDIQFRGPLPICETTRHQTAVPSADLRVRFVLVEGDPGGIAAFDRITVSAEIELYTP